MGIGINVLTSYIANGCTQCMHSAKIIFVMALIVILLKIIMLTWLAPQIYRVSVTCL